MQALLELVRSWPLGLALLLLLTACSSSWRAVAESLEHSPADTWLLRWALTASPRWKPVAVWLNRWADRSQSWKNKYKPGTENSTHVPRYPGATTWLVWTTDLWHLANGLEVTSWVLALAWALAYPVPAGLPLWQGLAAAALLKAWASLVFEGLYRLIRPSK